MHIARYNYSGKIICLSRNNKINEITRMSVYTNHDILKNVSGQCPSSANKILENSINERDISVENTIVKPHKIQI